MKGTYRVSQVLDASLPACHGLMTPAALQNLTFAQCSGQALQRVCDSFVLASRAIKHPRLQQTHFEAVPALKGGRSPLRPARFSVYASPALFAPPHGAPSQAQHSIRVGG